MNPSMDRFVKKHHVSMTCEGVDRNPLMEGDEWSRTADHWRCKIVARAGGKKRTLNTYFSKGSGHHGAEPKITEVFSALSLDAMGFENARDFEDWASEYGYSADSRKAEKAYTVVGKQAASLKQLLGEDAFQELLYKTESD
jgi:hypothetical protein